MDFNRSNYLKKLPLQKVESTNIAGVAFDKGSSTLVIKFTNSGLYSYTPITEAAFRDFMKSPSKGKYFAKNIRTNESIMVNCLTPKQQKS